MERLVLIAVGLVVLHFLLQALSTLLPPPRRGEGRRVKRKLEGRKR